MKLKPRFILLLTAILIGFTLIAWLLSGRLMDRMNQQWGGKFSRQQVLYDKYRTLLPLQREIALARQMAAEPAIINMALNEQDPEARLIGIAAMEKYRFNFRDHSYFAAFSKSQNYYFNDAANQYAGKQLRYKLVSANANDKWFYATILGSREYQVNVNTDVKLKVTKAWINVLIRSNNKTLGIIGTGIDLADLLKETVDVSQPGITNLFIDQSMAIQLNSDPQLIDYMTVAKTLGQRIKVDVLLKNPADIKRLQQAMQTQKLSPSDNSTFLVDFEGKKHLLGVTFLPEIGWFDLTLMDEQSLNLFGEHVMWPILFALILMLSLLSVALALQRWILRPINALKASTEKIQQGDFNVGEPIRSNDEIGDLSRSFCVMAEHVRNSNRELEDKVRERTEELHRLTEIDSLTGLLNRRGITIRFENEIARQSREGGMIGLLLLDLDHFKNINDSYGHAAGDLALCEVAKVLQDSKRTYDHAGRWGGEEFLILLSNCLEPDLLMIAEGIRQKIRSLKIQACGQSFSFTVSIGAHQPNMPQTLDTMLQIVDDALFAAKDAGRDCVRSSK